MKKKYLIISIISFLIILLGISYAFYTVQIEGTGKNYVINTPDLKVIFTDGTAIGASGQKPGEWTSNNTKTFTLESQTDEVYKYNIVLNDYLNTLETYGYLQYKLEHTSANGYDSSGWVNLPQSKIARTYIIASNVELAIGDTHEYTLTFRYENDPDVDQSADMGKSFSATLGITKGETPLWASNETALKSHILKDNLANFEESVNERTSFNTIYDSSSETFFKTNNAELGERVYYYAGDATNNWVIFGKQKEESTLYIGYDSTRSGNTIFTSLSDCQNASTYYYNCDNLYHSGDDIYWRIIRTNEDSTGGGVRLLYAGSGSVTDNQGNKIIGITQNGYIGTSNWYSSGNKPNYVGYTIGTNDFTEGITTISEIRGNNIDSNIKTEIDSYYETTFLNTDYENYIDTKAVYCNDRSTTEDRSSGIIRTTWFGAIERNYTNNAPSHACGAKALGFKKSGNWSLFEGNTYEDRYAKDIYTIDGVRFTNGYLDFPIALITADEVKFAGGEYSTPNQSVWYYLNACTSCTAYGKSIIGNKWWWTMSPSFFYNNSDTTIWGVSGTNGSFYHYGETVAGTRAIRPVVSLKSDTVWLSGDGTPNNPYQIQINQ